ncbi:MAG: type 4a pilus biogenesis protein PilO [Omnitrophica bacterium]|nr:type 4a pilus biogenesis protein PilO [Candidatus Omnitrophota bacterium]
MPRPADFIKNISELKLDESKKKFMLFYALGLGLVFVLYVLFFLKPSISVLADLVPKLRERKVAIRAVVVALPHKEKLYEKRSAQQKKLAKYEEKLSREKDLPVLLESLSKMARSSNVKILGIKPLVTSRAQQKKTSPEKNAVYQEVPILLSAESGYHELGSFLGKLESDKRYMKISDIKIETNRSNARRHRVQFVVYAYTFKERR